MSWWDDFWDWLLNGEPDDPDPPDDPFDGPGHDDFDEDWDELFDDSDCLEWVWDVLPLVDLNGEEVPGTGTGHWENICYA